MRNIRTLALAAPALLFLLGSTTGCQSDESTAAPGGTATAATSASDPAAAVSASAGAATSGNANSGEAGSTGGTSKARQTTATARAVPNAGVSACRNADLKTTVTLQGNDDYPTLRAMVTVTNSSKHTCSLTGWASFTPTNAAGQPVSVPSRQVNQPGPAESFTVAPGISAFAGIKWISDDEDSSWSNGLRVSVSGPAAGAPWATLEEFGDLTRNPIRMKSLQVGTLQPSHQGVVAW
jgi:hypothetical protein